MVSHPVRNKKDKWPKGKGLEAMFREELVANPNSDQAEDMIDIGMLKERDLAELLAEFALKIKHVQTRRWRLRQYVMDSRLVLNRIERLNAKKWARDIGLHRADIEKHQNDGSKSSKNIS